VNIEFGRHDRSSGRAAIVWSSCFWCWKTPADVASHKFSAVARLSTARIRKAGS